MVLFQTRTSRLAIPAVAAVFLFVTTAVVHASDVDSSINPFLKSHCIDCHGDGTAEGGLSFDTLSRNIDARDVFARWERIYDRVAIGEMPPKDSVPVPESVRKQFLTQLAQPLTETHRATKGTVLRRLNRQEYENTVNDTFGISLNLVDVLPEDGRSREFDTVGESLGVSMIHLERYLEAARKILDDAIAKSSERPKSTTTVGSYLTSREAERFLGTRWLELSDGAVVRFNGGGYPSGMMRTANVRRRGRYKVRVEGYAYQSDKRITFSVGAVSFKRGAEVPTFGYYSFAPGTPDDNPQSIEFEAWIEDGYMIQIEPYGINDPEHYKRKTIEGYKGPGLAIKSVTLEGPLVDEFPTRGHNLILDGFERDEIPPRNPRDREKSWYRPKFETTTANEQKAVRDSLVRVASALYRRPVEGADVAAFVTLYEQERKTEGSIEDSLRVAVSGLLCSPRFLYLQEEPGNLDDYAVASRLSYMLHRTRPDEELLKSAASGRLLKDPAALHEQAQRLMAGPRFERFITDLCDSWLDLRNMDFTVPDRQLFPEYDDYLRWSMPVETQTFVRAMIDENHPVRDFVAPDFAMLNSRLADHYDLPPVDGSAVRKVPLDGDSVRGGLLAQASILKVTANGTNSSPVVRGAWVMERLLGDPPPPPPPGVPGVEPDIGGASTLRELLDKHRDQIDCNACHRKIDPPGFAMEVFNPIGGYRDRYRSLGEGEVIRQPVKGQRVRYRLGPSVDCTGQTAEGQGFDSFAEFQSILANHDRQLAKTVAEKLLTFAVGREMGFSDRPEIDRIVDSVAADGYRVGDILQAVIASNILRTK